MTLLYIGIALFFGLHFYSAFRSREHGRDLKQNLGEAKFMGLYSIGAILGLGLIVWGYKQAPISEYIFAGIGSALTINSILMLIAFVLLLASQLPAGHIKRMLKHPMLLAVSLWAISHLIDGANLKQILLFGSFLAFSLIDMVVASLRGSDIRTSPAGGKSSSENILKYDVLAVVIGVTAYFIVAQWLHVGISAF